MTTSPARTADLDRGDYLRTISELFWPAPAQVSMGRAGASSGPADPGSAGSELIVLPGLGAPRLIVPAGRRAALAALRGYGEPGSARTALAIKALQLTVLAGLGGFVLRDRLVVRRPAGAETIESAIGALIGQHVEIAMHIRGPRANSKPVLQLLTPAGDVAGYAKIAVNELTADLVTAERKALTTLTRSRLGAVRPPEVLASGLWRGQPLLVLSPLPVTGKRTALQPAALTGAMIALARSAGVRTCALDDSSYWRQLCDRFAGLPDGADQAALRPVLGRLAERAGRTELSFGAWHGDWTPWNMASTPDGMLVWDWERYDAAVPLGFDALHYWLQERVVSCAAEPAEAALLAVRQAPALLEPFGVASQEAATLTALLYLAELSVRYLADRQEQAGARLGAPGRWLIPALTGGAGQL